MATYRPKPLISSPSLVAIVSVLAGLLFWAGIPIALRLLGDTDSGRLLGLLLTGGGDLVAIIAGHVALRSIARSGGRLCGTGLARTGLTLGYLGLALALVLVLLAALFTYPGSTGGAAG